MAQMKKINHYGKNKKKVEDEDYEIEKPKRACNAFFIFRSQEYENVKRENPGKNSF
jgi:hypothetical protein